MKIARWTAALCAGLAIVACSEPPPPAAEAPEPVPRPTTGPLENSRGTVTVPGPAFMDGRDAEATPPLTVMSINVWDSASRTSRACSLAHGAAVDVSEASYNDGEGRYYFRVDAESCSGWVPESFVSLERHPVLGDRH